MEGDDSARRSHLLRMTVNDRTASSGQLAEHWSTATGVLMSASSIRRRLLHHGLRARDHDRRIRVRHYAGQSCLPECVIERHSDLTPEVMVCSTISYHGQSNLLRIEGNLNSSRYVREVLYSPKSFPSFKASLKLSFSRLSTYTCCKDCSRFPFSPTHATSSLAC
ncbi:hypothetical protein TNCV_4603871 [Trichonephila clavipes]|nr:hypothetical protein TNCV_4603871 [Trichonephila clavipes]